MFFLDLLSLNAFYWIGFNLFILAMLLLDLYYFHKEAHEVSLKESLLWSGVWIALALLFFAGLFFTHGKENALNFLAGYLIEKSLSIDNLFVFLMIFTYFCVPNPYRHKILFWGIVSALVMRAIFIFGGILLIQNFHWLIYLFGVLLIITGIKLGIEKGDKEIHPERNLLLKGFRFFFPVTESYEGDKFFVKRNGRYWATPLMVVLITIETSDLFFAIDSVPAILAITQNPFIVYTSNVFAILGLRSLYFSLASLMSLFRFLNYGLAALLIFIGLKMLFSGFVTVPIVISLAIIAGILALSIGLSVLIPEKI